MFNIQQADKPIKKLWKQKKIHKIYAISSQYLVHSDFFSAMKKTLPI
jgi:hypothetical protein